MKIKFATHAVSVWRNLFLHRSSSSAATFGKVKKTITGDP
jgi:hypothetical protein